MATFATYSKGKNGMPQELVYDIISPALKAQIYHICHNFFTQVHVSKEWADSFWKSIGKVILEEHGLSDFPTTLHRRIPIEIVMDYFKQLVEVDKALDVIHIIFVHLEKFELYLLKESAGYLRLGYKGSEAISDLNTRFKENGCGYEYVSHNIVRVDNQLLHANQVTKTLSLIADPDYKNVNDEYITALEHFRHGRKPDCLTWCLSAFESTIKVIADKNGWEYRQNMTSSDLIKLLFEKNFLPVYQEQALLAIKNFITNSLPPTRNKFSSHGKGVKVIDVPNSIVNYMIYITGSTIQLLVETQKELEKGGN